MQLDQELPTCLLGAGHSLSCEKKSSVSTCVAVCVALTRGNKEETADDEDASPDYRTDSLDQLQQKVPNLMAQMNGIAQHPTTAQITPT